MTRKTNCGSHIAKTWCHHEGGREGLNGEGIDETCDADLAPSMAALMKRVMKAEEKHG